MRGFICTIHSEILSDTNSRQFDEIHHYQDLIRLFDHNFAAVENTRLVKGSDEPLYLPACSKTNYHQIIFAHGYFASALHEIAHGCIAGKERRLLQDYGYWYCPDGRNQQQQTEFEQVEVSPQAIEWAFSIAANRRFRVSTDNLNGAQIDVVSFQDKVQQQALAYLQQGFPARSKRFIQVLHDFYQTEALQAEKFTWLEPLRCGDMYE
jgi:elongation factor P hydroxylase